MVCLAFITNIVSSQHYLCEQHPMSYNQQPRLVIGDLSGHCYHRVGLLDSSSKTILEGVCSLMTLCQYKHIRQ